MRIKHNEAKKSLIEEPSRRSALSTMSKLEKRGYETHKKHLSNSMLSSDRNIADSRQTRENSMMNSTNISDQPFASSTNRLPSKDRDSHLFMQSFSRGKEDSHRQWAKKFTAD